MQDQPSHDTADAMHLLTTSITNHLDRAISTSHTILLDRIIRQDEIWSKQQQILDALSDRVAHFPPPSIDPMLAMQDMQSQTRRLAENVEEALTKLSSAMNDWKDFQNSMNQHLDSFGRQLMKSSPQANMHARDDNGINTREHTVDNGLAGDSSSSGTPATAIPPQWNHLQTRSQQHNSRDGAPSGSHHGTRLLDLNLGREDYNSAINQNLCINPLNTLRNPTSGSSHQNPHSNTPPNESTAYQHLRGTSTPSLPDPSSLLHETPRNPVASTSVVTTSPRTRIRSYTNRSYSALTELSELDPFHDERPAAGNLVPVSFSPETTKGHLQDDDHKTKRPRVDLDLSQSLQSPFKAGRKGRTHLSSRKSKSTPAKSKGSSQSKTNIWPKRGRKNVTSNQFIQCDRCQLWFHWGCVAVHEGDARLEEDSKFACPPCVLTNARYKPRSNLGPGTEQCSRPDCKIKSKPQEEFFIERFVGRFDRGAELSGPGRYSWLIKWEGYPVDECVWTPGDEIEAARNLIERFETEAKSENALIGGRTLVLLEEAIQAGWDYRID